MLTCFPHVRIMLVECWTLKKLSWGWIWGVCLIAQARRAFDTSGHYTQIVWHDEYIHGGVTPDRTYVDIDEQHTGKTNCLLSLGFRYMIIHKCRVLVCSALQSSSTFLITWWNKLQLEVIFRSNVNHDGFFGLLNVTFRKCRMVCLRLVLHNERLP